jgi:hypothetical protein
MDHGGIQGEGKRKMTEAYLEVLEEGYFEVQEAFKGLADENVWKRPAEGLLSVGELAGHIAYWEAVRLAGKGGEPNPEANGVSMIPDLAKCRVSSLLIDHQFNYYPKTIAQPPSQEQLAMTAAQVCSELVRVHNESVVYFKALNPDLDSCPPGWLPNNTYRAFLSYAAFHVAYHTGQIYSARHLLGEETVDN